MPFSLLRFILNAELARAKGAGNVLIIQSSGPRLSLLREMKDVIVVDAVEFAAAGIRLRDFNNPGKRRITEGMNISVAMVALNIVNVIKIEKYLIGRNEENPTRIKAHINAREVKMMALLVYCRALYTILFLISSLFRSRFSGLSISFLKFNKKWIVSSMPMPIANEAISAVAISSFIPNMPITPKFTITAMPRGIMERSPIFMVRKTREVIMAITTNEKRMEIICPVTT